MERTDIPDDLDEAISEFIRAAHKYREFLKRLYPDRLCGVIYCMDENGDLALFSEPRYASIIRDAVATVPNFPKRTI